MSTKTCPHLFFEMKIVHFGKHDLILLLSPSLIMAFIGTNLLYFVASPRHLAVLRHVLSNYVLLPKSVTAPWGQQLKTQHNNKLSATNYIKSLAFDFYISSSKFYLIQAQ